MSDTRLTFEVFEQSTGKTYVFAGDLQTGDVALVASNTARPSGPVYSGDDTAIIFMFGDQVPTGVSLARQGLAADHLTPSGAATLWVSDAGYGVIYRRGTFSGPQANCASSDTTLCLNGGRFQVTATWTTPQGQNGPGHSVQLTSDTGYFWFFSSGNVEVVVKAVNACSFGQRFWVFAAAASAAVDDLVSGFAAAAHPAGQTVSTRSPASPAACTPTATALCLNSGRFRLEATYRTPQGQTGNGQAVAFTPDTGYFWFFSSNNVEVIVKAVNACTFNPPRYWVFAAGLTNVEVTMRVTDTLTGAVRQYVNPLNTAFAPIQDTNAFATCP